MCKPGQHNHKHKRNGRGVLSADKQINVSSLTLLPKMATEIEEKHCACVCPCAYANLVPRAVLTSYSACSMKTRALERTNS